MAVSATTPGLLTARIRAGIVSEVIRRITAPMIEGMVNLTLLTLLVIPDIYYLWKRLY
jgi:Cu(I)/Ag(I) efflux system membrane protein CusA/SilA